MTPTVSIAVFSDVICPWCYLGKKRLERGLADAGVEAQVAWLPFELNPTMPPGGMARADYRAAKFGRERAAALDAEMAGLGLREGVNFAFERMARTPNTRAAHALVAFASVRRLGGPMVDALFRAYFEEARDVGDPEVLVALAAELGIAADDACAALLDERLLAEIAATESEAARIGVAGVPFFIVERRWAISGAQPPAAWGEVLRDIAADGSASRSDG